MTHSRSRRPFPLSTFSEAARHHRHLWVFCLKCGHGVRLEIKTLVPLYPEHSLQRFETECRCRKCKAKRAHVVLDDGMRPGDLQRWE